MLSATVRPPATRATRPRVIGHRGASAVAPENTLPAFDAAWSSGCCWIEADVQPTADNVPMMLHDGEVDRTTDGRGSIRDLPAEQVRALDAGSWFDARSCFDADSDSPDTDHPYAAAVVPYLSEVLARLSASRSLLLEIKGEHTFDQVAAEMAVLKASEWDDRVLVESFEVETLRHVRSLDPGRPVGLLVQELHDDPVAVCAQLGAVTYNPDHRVLRQRPEVVGELHAAGIEVIAYTVDDPDDWEFLTELGVDGIVTNTPGELLAWQQAN